MKYLQLLRLAWRTLREMRGERRTLPDHLVKEGLRMAESATVFGVPLANLTRDELLAVTAKTMFLYRQLKRKGRP